MGLLTDSTSHLPGLPRAIALSGAALPILGLLGLLLTLFSYTKYKNSPRRKLPPGPKGLPLVGNMFDFADSDQVRNKVHEWTQKYGDVFYTRVGGTDFIWLSSPKAVKDLLDRKSGIYSSRAPTPFAQDVASGGNRQLLMPYGKQWRELRRSSHDLLNQRTSFKYLPVQDFESKQVIYEFLHDPDAFYQHNRRYSASVIMLVTYGYRLPSWTDPLMKGIYEVLDNLTEMTAPGAHAVDSFPQLARLPQFLLGNWRTQAKKVYDHDSKFYLNLWNRLKREIEDGTAKPCFCKGFYESTRKNSTITDILAAYTCGGLVEAGSETTSSTLNNFMLAMTLNPHVVVKAQEELDRVVGTDRMPTWEDEKDLPYIRAIIKECLRWRPVNKFGMTHAVTEDDWYEGMYIPKDAVVVLNWWGIHRNPKYWKDPDAFMPERYIGYDLPAADYINIPDPNQRDHFTYGAGRRVCPGVHVAEKSLYINIARVLWGFNISKKRDANGNVIEPEQGTLRGFLTTPLEFAADIKVRSPKHASVIDATWTAAEKEGLHYYD